MSAAEKFSGPSAAGNAPQDLRQLLDVIEDTANEQSEVSFRDLYDAVGHRSFGPLLLVPAWAGCASRQVPWIE